MPFSRHWPHYTVIGLRLKAARKAAHLSQARVGARLGYTQTFISKCELAYRRVDAAELAEFAALYGVPIERFFEPMTEREQRTFDETQRILDERPDALPDDDDEGDHS